MTEAVLVAWHKNVGDPIKPGDLLAEVETDKATMELESYQEGTLLHIGIANGQTVAVDGILAIVGKPGEDYHSVLQGSSPAPQATAPEKPKEAADSKPAATAEASLPEGAKVIRMPLLSDTMTEGKIIGWNKKTGDQVKSDDVLAEVETDKATMEVVGYEEGTLLHVGVEAGQVAKVNQLIAIIGKAGTDVSAYVAAEKSGANNPPAATAPKINTHPSAPESTALPVTPAPSNGQTSADQRLKASPLAKKLAAEKGIPLNQVTGSGDNGRIIRKDIDNFVPVRAESSTVSSSTDVFTAVTGTEGHTDLPLSQMRKAIARRLSESKTTAPHFYLSMEINMDSAMLSRTSINEISPVKVSFNDIIIKACALALRKHPDVNSSWMGDFIRRNHHIHIGSAVAIPDGLIVPVVRFADQKSLSQIAQETKELYGKAKEKKLQPAEFSGNTFSISNLGMMDIDSFTAIINPPDSAILAVGAIRETVVRKEAGFGVSHIMKVTLSCDHRSVDGATGAAFLQSVKAFLENPVTMLV
jgi:pyruvate dehydrogenase E2 component (dihydrolipoamide acetyltransferase)